MAVHRLLQGRAFSPEDVTAISSAYEQALRALGLPSGDTAENGKIAKRVIEIAQTGVLDPAQITTLTLESLGRR